MAEYIRRSSVDREFTLTRDESDTIIGLYERILDIPNEDVVSVEVLKYIKNEINKLDEYETEVSNGLVDDTIRKYKVLEIIDNYINRVGKKDWIKQQYKV